MWIVLRLSVFERNSSRTILILFENLRRQCYLRETSESVTCFRTSRRSAIGESDHCQIGEVWSGETYPSQIVVARVKE